MKICAISDLHGHLPEIPPCDVLIIAGDICPTTHHGYWAQRRFLQDKFTPWLANASAKSIVGIAGNHDFIFDMDKFHIPKMSWDYLQDSSITIEGIKFYGTPWTPIFRKWAFMRSEQDLQALFAKIPDDTDVLITHGPPFATLDMNVDGVLCGNKALAARMSQFRCPPIHVFGHIHENWGKSTGLSYNVSYVNEKYEPVGQFTEFTLDKQPPRAYNDLLESENDAAFDVMEDIM